ncbi:MAG: acyl CoA:acetate/3-ketoacid CoA transferase, partial [Acidobacteria bacterium]|nr:acyl CoA:acetate/3-ketoacid CoA transferase [Acidobacteriota bacterium]
DELVELLTIDGREILRYKPFRVDVAIVRATYADTRGNLSPEEEAVDLDIHTVALAGHNSGGKVIAQVRQVVEAGALRSRAVRIPGIMVDAVVEEPRQQQFYGLDYDRTVSGNVRAHLGALAAELPPKLERRIIARRAALELRRGESLNFGFGIPGGIFGVIAEQGNGTDYWMSVEQGTHNGRMMDDRLFGAARNTDAIVPSVEQFDYYSGGGIDTTFLGMGEVDAAGNVNVSHLGGTLIGPGGFMEIAQNAKRVVFCGTFDAQGTRLELRDGELRLIEPGRVRKFVRQVERITFPAGYASRTGQEVLYITERAVFRLVAGGLELIEVAPGIEVERDILPFMDFRPLIGSVQVMSVEVLR